MVHSGAMWMFDSRRFCFVSSFCENKLGGGMPSISASYVCDGNKSSMTMCTLGSSCTGTRLIASCTCAAMPRRRQQRRVLDLAAPVRDVSAQCFAHQADIAFHACIRSTESMQRLELAHPLVEFSREASDITLQLGEMFVESLLEFGGGGRLIRTPLAAQNGQDS
jgi:hypothetical protein